MSILPFSSYDGKQHVDEDVDDDDRQQRPSKRQRIRGLYPPPNLVSETDFCDDGTNTKSTSNKHPSSGRRRLHQSSSPSSTSQLLRLLPNDALSHCLSYLNTTQDRFGLQLTCTIFKHLSNEDSMLATLELGGRHQQNDRVLTNYQLLHGGEVLERNGERRRRWLRRVNDDVNNNNDDDDDDDEDDYESDNMMDHPIFGVNNNNLFALDHFGPALHSIASPSLNRNSSDGGIILDCDTSFTACTKLLKFAVAGNKQAIYMIAMILCYCYENVSEGLALLRHAAASEISVIDDETQSSSGGGNGGNDVHLPSVYALALILRDSQPNQSEYYLTMATNRGYAPAWQEKLTATEMRAKFGDLDAARLMQYLDPPCLNKLLGRHYLECQRVRKHQTSHCWNSMCGRWAYKAMRTEDVGGGAAAADDEQQQRISLFRFQILWNERVNHNDVAETVRHNGGNNQACQPCEPIFSIETLMNELPPGKTSSSVPSPREKLLRALRGKLESNGGGLKVSRMKMCSSCRRAKYCSKLCQVYDWRSGKHKMECQFL